MGGQHFQIASNRPTFCRLTILPVAVFELSVLKKDEFNICFPRIIFPFQRRLRIGVSTWNSALHFVALGSSKWVAWRSREAKRSESSPFFGGIVCEGRRNMFCYFFQLCKGLVSLLSCDNLGSSILGILIEIASSASSAFSI